MGYGQGHTKQVTAARAAERGIRLRGAWNRIFGPHCDAGVLRSAIMALASFSAICS